MGQFKIYLLPFIFLASYLSAQQVNTLYFMENAPTRHLLNPAFQPAFQPTSSTSLPPKTQFYFSFPVLGYTNFSFGNNALTIKDLIYKQNGQTVSFLHPNGDIPKFYAALHPLTSLHFDFETNLLGFGYKYRRHFWTFNLTEKIGVNVGFPKPIFNLALFGMPSYMGNNFNFTNLQFNLYAYTEAAFGYSKQINQDTKLGIKLKYLYGTAHVSNNNNQISLLGEADQWNLKAAGTLSAATPVQLQIAPDFSYFSVLPAASVLEMLQATGKGAGLDIGIESQLDEQLTLSSSLTDLGYIHWTRNTNNLNYTLDYTFKGVINTTPETKTSSMGGMIDKLSAGNTLVDSLTTAVKNSGSLTQSQKAYYSFTPAKLNLGGEYKFFNNGLSAGALYKLYLGSILFSERSFSKVLPLNELTFSLNARPSDWFNASMSYSLLNGHWSTLGAAVGLRTARIHWMLAADYIPLVITNLPGTSVPISYHSNQFNLAFGINYIFQATPAERPCKCSWR